MAAAPLVGVAVGAAQSISGMASASKQRAEQQRQLDIQAQSVKDQKVLSEYQINEQLRQVDAMGERERMLGLQAQSIGLIQNEMQAAQQGIAQTQAQIANDQQSFMNNQRAVAREAAAQLQAAEVMSQLQQVSQRSIQEGAKTEQEANAIAAQRMLLQGAGSTDTQSGQAFLERVMNAVASGAINSTSLFNSEMDDAQRQLAYEQLMAQLEQGMGQSGVDLQTQLLGDAARMNEVQRQGNAQNINTQTARNNSALDYETASQRGQLNLARAGNSTNAQAQLSSISSARSAIPGPGFADMLGAVGNLGMSLYQSGIFSRQPSAAAVSPMASPSGILSGVSLPAFNNQADGLFRQGLPTNHVLPSAQPVYSLPGANDLMKYTNRFG